MPDKLDELLQRFGIVTEDRSLYEAAFTHRSYTNEHPECTCYDRLEFLGDSILDMTVGDFVYEYFPDFNSGLLSKTRSYLVDTEMLSHLSRDVYHLDELVRYSVGETDNTKFHKKVNEDVFEAFIGAAYLDQGYVFVRKMLINIYKDLLPDAYEKSQDTDPKGRLSNILGGAQIEYVVVSHTNTGASQSQTVINAMLNHVVLGTGTGRNRKEAEFAAARDAISKKVGK